MPTVTPGFAVETEVGRPLSGGYVDLGQAVESEFGLRARANVAGAPAWSLVVIERGATIPAATFTCGDQPEDAPIVAGEGQDPLYDVGAGQVAMPVSTSFLDEMVENRLMHVKSAGQTLTTTVIGATSEVVVSPSGPTGQNATVALRSLVDVLNEGFVPPARGFDTGPDFGRMRTFSFVDINRDNSDFDPVEDQGTVTAAQATYTDGYGAGITYPDDVHLVGSTLDHDGWVFLYADLVFPAGTFRYRFRGAADNELTNLWVASEVIQGKTWGYSQTWEKDVEIVSDGIAATRVSAVIYNAVDPVRGAPFGVGDSNLAMEIIQLDDGGGEGPNSSLFHATNATDWEMQAYPLTAPGMSFTQVARILLAENQVYGFLGANIILDPNVDDTHDSNGALIEEEWDITTRTCMPLGDFFLHEMGRYFCDIKLRVDEATGDIVWELYSLGGRGGTVGETIEADEVSEFRIDRERTAATSLAVEYGLGFTLLEGDPPAGQPDRVGFLSLGQADTLAQAGRLGGPELGDFARTRTKIALKHVTTDGRQYWTGDSIDSLPVDRDFNTDGARVMSMTWEIDGNGNLAFTPEFGDIMVPVAARASNALARMAPGSLRGRSGPAR